MGQGGAHAGDSVGGDGNSDAGAADGDAGIGLLGSNAFAHNFSVIGVSTLFRRPSLVVGIACCFEMLSNRFFDGESGVVRADDDARLGRDSLMSSYGRDSIGGRCESRSAARAMNSADEFMKIP
jgi:hypothetical protein